MTLLYKAIREKEPFVSAKHKLYDAEGNPTLCTGAVVIIDGGYHKVRYFDGGEHHHWLFTSFGNSHLPVDAV